MIFDGHNHLKDDYSIQNGERYLKQLSSAGVDKVMLCTTSHEYPGGNAAVREFMEKYHDRIIGFAYIDVDRDDPHNIVKYKDQGFSGLKVIETQHPYDDAGYMKYYEAASRADMPILFHTGFLGLEPGHTVNCNYYRPITLDTIARCCPDLRMLCAHMGNPWWDEGFLVMWKHKNIYCDMSGLSACRRDMELWVKLFKPNGELHEAVSKLIFASDQFMFGSSDYTDYYLKYHEKLFNMLELDQKRRDLILYSNFLILVGAEAPES